MDNPIRMRQSHRLIEERLMQTLQEVNTRYMKGEIKSKSSYLYETKSALRSFLQNLTTPSFTMRPADRLADANPYNAMVKEIYDDLNVIIADLSEMNSLIEESFRQIETERKSLTHLIKETETDVKEITAMNGDSPNEIVFQDTFTDMNRFDGDMVSDFHAKIWPSEGILTLNPIRTEKHMDKATIQIASGNGFPGNTKEIHVVDGGLLFKGEDNLRVNPAEIIDGSMDTWFEYESFSIDEEEKRRTANFGYTYEEGLDWTTPKEQPLELQLLVTFDKARLINWLHINPFLPTDHENTYSEIVSVELRDGKGGIYSVPITDTRLQDEKILLFETRLVKEAAVTLRQPTGYLTLVGHFYYRERARVEYSHYERNVENKGRRIDGPTPSIESLGVSYDQENRKILYPVLSMSDVTTKSSTVQSTLFYPFTTKESENMESGVEEVKAARKVIGLREIDLATYEFEKTGTYISEPFESSYPIESVSLEVDIEDTGHAEDLSVIYYVSPNNGNDWYKIRPRKSVRGEGKSLYIFNASLPTESQVELFGYVDQKETVTSLRIKIEMERKDEETFKTPILKGYRLHALTRKG